MWNSHGLQRFFHSLVSCTTVYCKWARATKSHARPAMTWSAWASAESDQSLHCPFEEALGPWLPTLRAPNKNSDQTGCMPRLIWVFAWHTVQFIGLSSSGSIVINIEQCRPRSDCSWRSRLIGVYMYTVRYSFCIFWGTFLYDKITFFKL